MRGLTSTILLIGVLAGLGAYIYFVDSKRPEGGDAAAKEKVFTVETDKIEEIRVTSEKQTSVLKKVDGKWRLVEPTQADADASEVSSLTTALTGLEVNRVVDENATDLQNYGLAEPRIAVSFTGRDGVAGQLHLGDKTATQGDVYAMRPGEKRVFLVAAYQETSLAKKPFDFRDKRILMFERDKADVLEITREGQTIQLARGASDWEVRQPLQARADYSAIEGLITRLSSASMSKIVDGVTTLDKPATTVTIGAGSNRATLAIAAEKAGETWARDMSRNMVFVIEPTLATDLAKPVDDYRDKDVFEFRPFNVAQLRIVRGTETFEFKKIPGTGEVADKWQRTTAGAAAADVEASKVDDLFAKLTALRAQSFVASAPSEAAITISASYDEGKFERVRFASSGSDTVAVRDGEPGAGKLDATAYGELVKALDAAVK